MSGDLLFDPDQFPSPQDGESKPKRAKSQGKPVIESDGFWFVVTTTQGVMDFCHRISDQKLHNGLGSVLTKCDQPGRTLEAVPKGALIHPCPRCAAAS